MKVVGNGVAAPLLLNLGAWSKLLISRSVCFDYGERPPILSGYDAGSAPGPALTMWSETSLNLSCNQTPIPRSSIPQYCRCTDWVILFAFQYFPDTITITQLLFLYPSSPITTCANSLLSGNACYHSVRNFVSSSLLTKDTHIKIHRAKFCSLFSTSLKIGLPHRQRACETRVLSKI